MCIRDRATVNGALTANSKTPFVEVIDQGNGIDPEKVESIFEPFFTTESKGSGLGLYIARELCESNKATLNYLPVPTSGCCFRISFSLPDMSPLD